MSQDEELDSTGAYAFKPLLEKSDEIPDEYTNPAGSGRGDCNTEEGAAKDADCDLEITAQTQDLVLEETMPGYGIPGYEGEEAGGA